MGRFYNPNSNICNDVSLYLDLSIAGDFDMSITVPEMASVEHLATDAKPLSDTI